MRGPSPDPRTPKAGPVTGSRAGPGEWGVWHGAGRECGERKRKKKAKGGKVLPRMARHGQVTLHMKVDGRYLRSATPRRRSNELPVPRCLASSRTAALQGPRRRGGFGGPERCPVSTVLPGRPAQTFAKALARSWDVPLTGSMPIDGQAGPFPARRVGPAVCALHRKPILEGWH